MAEEFCGDLKKCICEFKLHSDNRWICI